ncbi:MAG: HAMP domain-containing histidine kinase [Lentisphaerae bacterium]|nr:HAMP domain-containing histidine kinase [Lentisphaerota bacterium]
MHRRRDALLSIKTKAESVLVTYDLNAEIVRNYTGIDRGKVSNVDLTEIVEDYEELFGDEAEAKGVEFVVSRPPDAVIIRAHEDKLRRLVANLVENAVKYTDKGKVSVALAVKKSKFTLTVADTGIGMTEDEKRLMYHSQKGL